MNGSSSVCIREETVQKNPEKERDEGKERRGWRERDRVLARERERRRERGLSVKERGGREGEGEETVRDLWRTQRERGRVSKLIVFNAQPTGTVVSRRRERGRQRQTDKQRLREIETSTPSMNLIARQIHCRSAKVTALTIQITLRSGQNNN